MVSYFSFKRPIEKIAEAIQIGILEKPTKGKKNILFVSYTIILQILFIHGNLRDMKKYEVKTL